MFSCLFTIHVVHTHRPETTLTGTVRCMSAVGLQDVIRHATRTLGVDLCDWVQCSSVQSLQQAVQSIRAHQVKQAELKKVRR